MAALRLTAARPLARTVLPRTSFPGETPSACSRLATSFPAISHTLGPHTTSIRSYTGIRRDVCMPGAPLSAGLGFTVRQAALLSIPARTKVSQRDFHLSRPQLQEPQKKGVNDLKQDGEREVAKPSVSTVTKFAEQLAASTSGSSVDGTVEKPKKLSENIYTIPNFLTASRLATCPIIGWQVLEGNMKTATALLFFSALTDLLDGYLARRMNSHTVFGSIADPAADKALMTVMVVTLGIKGLIPPLLAMLIIGRDVGLVISAFYIRYKSLPPPKTFSRYWDFSLPSASVQPTQISKYNTFLQLSLVGLSTVLPIFSPETQELCAPAMTAFQWIVAGTTIWSGASYIFRRGAVTYLNRKP